ncbi:cell division protein FtsA [soil metagenome]
MVERFLEVMKVADQLIVGIDIGSTKFSSAVALYNRSGSIQYLGHGSTPSAGLNGGRVTDPEALARAVKMALDEVRHLAGAPIQDLVISVAGAQVAPIDRRGQIRLDGARPISQREVERAIESASSEDPEGLRTIHRVVRGFAVNGESTQGPLGRYGSDLEVSLRDFAVTTELVEGIREAAGAASTRVHAFVPGGVAAGEAALTAEERQQGVILVDIGGATTDVAVYIDGELHDLSGFPLGGHHLTQDLALVLEVPLEEAERLKCRDGVSSPADAAKVPVDWGPRGIARIQRQARDGTLSGDVVRAITGARMEQILQRAKEIALRTDGHNQPQSGSIVVTGGSSRLRGIEDVASAVFGLPARRGDILQSDGFPPIADPTSSASVGLVRYCASRGAWAAQPPPEQHGGRPQRLEKEKRGWTTKPARVPERRDEPVPHQQVNVIQYAGTVETRDWGKLMRDWMRGFIPVRTDA